jgi:hypothetical protein
MADEITDADILKEIEKRVEERLRITRDTDALEKHISNLQHELRDKRDYMEDGKTPNPFSNRFYNCTQQGQLVRADRARAERLAARAGTVIGALPLKEKK